jgi:hypothetical protein
MGLITCSISGSIGSISALILYFHMFIKTRLIPPTTLEYAHRKTVPEMAKGLIGRLFGDRGMFHNRYLSSFMLKG